MMLSPMWAEIADIYRASKKKRDINWFTEWVCRPPAAVVVYALKNTRVSPNQVTLASLAVSVAAAAMLVALPGHGWLIAAALVFELSFVLDCADGQLARLRGMASVQGHLLDFLMDEIKAPIVFAAVAARLWRFGGEDELYLFVGLAGVVVIGAGVAMTSFLRRPELSGETPDEDGQPAVVARRRGVIGGAVTAAEQAARAVVHYPQYIWLCAAVNRIDVYLWAYVGVNGLYFVRTLAVIAVRLGGPAPREGS